MSTPIDQVRELIRYRELRYEARDEKRLTSALASVLADAERFAALEAQNARLREALEGLQSDAQCTLDLYNKNGPTWTSRDSGEEYYSASYVIDSTEERIATIKAALTDTKGTP